MRLGSCVAVAVATSSSSDVNPSLGLPYVAGVSLKSKNKKINKIQTSFFFFFAGGPLVAYRSSRARD